jgi:energy-coupling factor transport system ATP-binding protein
MGTHIRKVAYAVILTALAAILGQLSIPISAGAKVAPSQHMVNVIAGVLVGPWYATAVAAAAAIIRNATGMGTVLAFPGGMIGAFVAGVAYRLTRKIPAAALGEIAGTGVMGALVSSLLIAPAIMHRPAAATAFVVPFLMSSTAGALIGLAALYALIRAGAVSPEQTSDGPR